MADSANMPETREQLVLTITDKGRTVEVSNVDPWIEERKTLLRRARDLLRHYNGSTSSLYPYHGDLVDIARRLAEIKVIFDRFNRERARRADANIAALVAYFSDPATMAGIDD